MKLRAVDSLAACPCECCDVDRCWLNRGAIGDLEDAAHVQAAPARPKSGPALGRAQRQELVRFVQDLDRTFEHSNEEQLFHGGGKHGAKPPGCRSNAIVIEGVDLVAHASLASAAADGTDECGWR
jgi:hypothetical protein